LGGSTYLFIPAQGLAGGSEFFSDTLWLVAETRKKCSGELIEKIMALVAVSDFIRDEHEKNASAFFDSLGPQLKNPDGFFSSQSLLMR